MPYSVRFYEDVTRYHETNPCRHHPRTYKTAEEAEDVAKSLLPDVREEHGRKVGYAVFNIEEGLENAVAIGPGVHDDA